MNKKMLVCSVAALAIVLACSIGLTQDKKQDREQKKKLAQEKKEWTAKLKEMTPEQRRVAIAKKAFEEDTAPWQEVRKIALSEKAAKTVEAIDKIIAAKAEQLKKKLAAPKKSEDAEQKKIKGEGKRGGKREGKGEGKREGKREGKGKKAETDTK